METDNNNNNNNNINLSLNNYIINNDSFEINLDYINQNNVIKELGDWEDVYSLPTRMTLDSFWFTMQKWSMNPSYMIRNVKKFSLINKSTYSAEEKLLSKFVFEKNLSGIFYENEINTINKPQNGQNNDDSQEEEDEKEEKKHKNDEKKKPNKHDNDGENEEDENIFYNKEIYTKDNNESELTEEYLDDNVQTIVYRRHLIPRLLNRDPTIDELIIHHKSNSCVQFIPLLPKEDNKNSRLLPFLYPKVLGFKIQYQKLDQEKDKDQRKKLSEEQQKEEFEQGEDNQFKAILKIQVIYFSNFKPKFDRVSKSILEKINRWGINFEIGYKKKANLDQIIPKNIFLAQYEEMKPRYRNMVEGWEDVTKTDPQKFIYEDVAIAAYLICIWRKENEELGKTTKQRFIDIGCGNGLLVNILNKEGYDGVGIDLRSRKIWSRYDAEVQKNLIEEAIFPKDTYYPDYDWIIGNHSDELTPWVPYITSKLPNQKFFLLPCCFFNFCAKFKDNDVRIGRYASYLNYIEKVSVECGFNVIKETLRIPSTKNIAFISDFRNPQLTEEQLVERRQNLLKSSNYIDFKPREREIKWVAQKRYRVDQFNPHLDPNNPENQKRIERLNNNNNSNNNDNNDIN
ncbi:hypothetical protein DICPUDRAFT_151114 [Dictyostelium purpureum]|uniref:tRNA (uracil-O(2)-)-methyltransferase n=1 Tax=Dictyostelium purpureum TaxID=5786 RepID=F0ZI09_DICPU|nr:uncharacterized protein DICPUDRAFT_151114 [Dictyostelium purpureum]EGC36428.1 hypothetical protein DICPUDRAFT_151114 [Dictyostelium purpureum]|eukprot:XP_003287061.1 hypothetical protein DICPUDRAFT_151114 [Dictyostelium purpureum]